MMKIINILHHSLSLTSPRADAWKTGSFEYVFAKKLKEAFPGVEHECWRPEAKIKDVTTWQDEFGITQRVFPSTALRYNYEYSAPMAKALSRLDPAGTRAILHGMYNYHFFALSGHLSKIPAIVQSHGGFPARYMVKNSARKLSRYLYYLMAGAEKAAFRRYETIFAISSMEKKYIEDTYPHRQLYFSPVGTDYERFRSLDKSGSRAEKGIPPGRKIILFVGRLAPQKGIEYLLEAVSLAARKHSDLCLYVLGMGQQEYEAHLMDYATRLGIAGQVEFKGYVANSTLPGWYSAADVFVMPSPLEWYGLVAAEALACGTPVIASRAGGVIDIVKAYECGVLVEPKNPAAIANAIGDILRGQVNTSPNLPRARAELGWDRKFELIGDIFQIQPERRSSTYQEN